MAVCPGAINRQAVTVTPGTIALVYGATNASSHGTSGVAILALPEEKRASAPFIHERKNTTTARHKLRRYPASDYLLCCGSEEA